MTQLTKIGSNGHPLESPTLAAFLDESTGLMWCATDASPKALKHSDAEKAVKDLRAAGFSDWRLPTIKELLTLVDYEKFNPACDAALGMKPERYWSSSPGASDPAVCAWFVGFYLGYAYYGDRGYVAFVRAVRAPASQ